MKDAHLAYVQGRYSTAVQLFRRFVDRYPASVRTAEARWWLARSYEQVGDLRAAVGEYRILAATEPSPASGPVSYETHAIRRLDELRQAGGRSRSVSSGHVAIALSRAQLPPLSALEPWLEGLARAGVTALVVDASTGGLPQNATSGEALSPSVESAPKAGVYFATTRARVIDDVLGRVVPLAHRHGLSVFANFSPHDLPWLEKSSEWMTLMYDPSAQTLYSSTTLDLFNPAAQSYIVGLLTDLAQTGVDGILLRARSHDGFAYEVGTSAIRGFETSFGLSIEPWQLLAPKQPGSDSGESANFWRWVGWKTRTYIAFLQRVSEAMRSERPNVRVMLEVHPETVTNPLRALAEYGEDVVEAKQRGFDLLLVPGNQQAVVTGSPSRVEQVELVRRLAEFVGDSRRVWTRLVVERVDPMPSEPGSFRRVAEGLGIEEDTSLLLSLDSSTVP